MDGLFNGDSVQAMKKGEARTVPRFHLGYWLIRDYNEHDNPYYVCDESDGKTYQTLKEAEHVRKMDILNLILDVPKWSVMSIRYSIVILTKNAQRLINLIKYNSRNLK